VVEGRYGELRIFWTSCSKELSWSSISRKSRLRVSTPDASRMLWCTSSVDAEAILQSVCSTTRIRSTPSRWVASTRVRSTSSVTRPPALRMILASPLARPSIAKGSIRESMQVTTASPRAAWPGRPSSTKDAA
jgi:hypothetical protein